MGFAAHGVSALLVWFLSREEGRGSLGLPSPAGIDLGGPGFWGTREVFPSAGGVGRLWPLPLTRRGPLGCPDFGSLLCSLVGGGTGVGCWALMGGLAFQVASGSPLGLAFGWGVLPLQWLARPFGLPAARV